MSSAMRSTADGQAAPRGSVLLQWLAYSSQSRLRRAALAFFFTSMAYWVYSTVLVPWIEPAVDPNQRIRRDLGEEIDVASRTREELAGLFDPGAWELDSPKVLEVGTARLLLRDYENLGNGQVRIFPCTLVVFPAGPDPARLREAVILEAPRGAVLEFDSPLDLRRAKIGKLLGGRLVGPITIRSAGRSDGAEDDLWIETREVQITPQRISTAHPVEFRLGRSHGAGQGLAIELAADPQTDDSVPAPAITGLKWLELVRDVRMHLDFEGARLLPADQDLWQPGGDAPRGAEPPPQVDIASAGPFRFDLQQHQATFERQVDVMRMRPNGPGDQLTCERLEIHFTAPQEPSGAAAGTAASPAGASRRMAGYRFKPQRLVAYGDPLVIRSAAEQLEARGKILAYQVDTRRLSLKSDGEVFVRKEASEVRARELYYRSEGPGKLGQVLAVGPGWIRGAAAEDDRMGGIEVRWSRSLRLRPHEDRQVLSVEGEAFARSDRFGSLSAESVHVWLREIAPPEAAVPILTPAGPPLALPARKPQRVQVVPDRLLAEDSVRVDAPQVVGNIQRLEVWFDGDLPADGTPRSEPPQPRVGQPDPGMRPVRPEPAKPASRFQIDGGLVRIQLRGAGGLVTLAEAVVEQNARVAELPPAGAAEAPLLLQGDRLHVRQPAPQQLHAVVSGQPARVGGRGLTLAGDTIRLDTAANLLWIDGPGTLTLEGNVPGAAPPPDTAPRTAVIHWAGRMTFDGLRADFLQQIAAEMGSQTLRTQTMQVTLNRRIAFGANLPRQSGEVEVAQVACSGGVVLQQQSFAADGLESIAQLHLEDLTLQPPSGHILGSGPGTISVVRRGPPPQEFALGELSPAAPQPAPPTNAAALNYLGVRFSKHMTGNLKSEQLVFADQVRAVYGPVPSWEDKLDPDDPEDHPPQAMTLTCDRLAVHAAPPMPSQPRSFELEALDNAVLEGREFTARAQRMSYSQAKDLIILEGDGRTDATLYRQSRIGGPTSRAAARKILFWRSQRRVQVDDARYLDLSDLPGPSGNSATRPNPAPPPR